MFPIRSLLNMKTFILFTAGTALLFLAGRVNFLLFHTTAELFSIVVACGIFIIAWNSRHFHGNGFFTFMGTASLAVAVVDLIHTLAYKGMNILPGGGAPVATQLWIGGRYLEAVSTLLAFYFLSRRVKELPLVTGFALATLALLASILVWPVFPACYIEGTGLTPFKVWSEYVIILIFAASLLLLRRSWKSFDPQVARLIAAAVGFFIAGEFAFTQYVSVYGIANQIGHILKIAGFYCLYRGVIVTGLTRPFALLFRELKESEERYRRLYNETPVMLHSIDREGRLTRVSSYWLEYLGYDREEVIGRRLIEFFSKESALRAEGEILPEFFRTGFIRDVSYQIVRKNGEVLDVVLSAASERGAQGEILCSLAVMVDVTERKQAEERIELLNASLAARAYQLEVAYGELASITRTLEERVRDEVAKNREKDAVLLQQSRQAAMGDMIGCIAHQWRQPLNAISLIVQDLAESFEYGGFNREYLDKSVDRVVDLTVHMSQTIEDFRDFFRPDREKVPFSLQQLIGKSLALVEGSYREHGITAHVAAREDADVVGYPNQFAQVILNILNNARDALVERKIAAPRVCIDLEKNGKGGIVIVRDNAGGIPEGIIDRIFEPYFTTKEAGKGTGIGLSMSKTIIERNMGGCLTARNGEEGAEFRIELP